MPRICRGLESVRVSRIRERKRNTLSARPSPFTNALCLDWNTKSLASLSARSRWNTLDTKEEIAIGRNSSGATGTATFGIKTVRLCQNSAGWYRRTTTD